MEDSIARNRTHWSREAANYVGIGRRAWAQAEPTWGIWQVPDADVGVLGVLGEVEGAAVAELGCGAA